MTRNLALIVITGICVVISTDLRAQSMREVASKLNGRYFQVFFDASLGVGNLHFTSVSEGGVIAVTFTDHRRRVSKTGTGNLIQKSGNTTCCEIEFSFSETSWYLFAFTTTEQYTGAVRLGRLQPGHVIVLIAGTYEVDSFFRHPGPQPFYAIE